MRNGFVAIAVAMLVLPAAAQGAPPSPDQAPGRHFSVEMRDLPKAYAEPASSNSSRVVARGGHRPIVPDGFEVQLFASGLSHPRKMLVLPDGSVLVSEQRSGSLDLLRPGANGAEAARVEFAQGFNAPYGLAWRDGEVLVADQDGIWRLPYRPGEPAPQARQTLLTAKGVFGQVSGHVNRDLEIDPGTGELYVGVGSMGNIAEEPAVKATIQRFAPDGSGQQTVSAGMRNPCGLAFDGAGRLWAVVQERDGLGDRLVPDYLALVKPGGFYGWPYAFMGPEYPQPRLAERAPEKVKATLAPDLLFQPHSATMDLAFYDGTMFPPEYRGDIFVAMHGSWNSSAPTGYKVVRVRMKDGKPVGGYENFVTGFWVSGTDRAEVWGRPADIKVARDGALLIADDVGGTIWRVVAKRAA